MVYGFTIVEFGEFTQRMYALFNEYLYLNADKLWEKAGIYDALHNSDGKICKEINTELEKGLKYFEDNEKELKKLNQNKNELDYVGAKQFLKEVVENCIKYHGCMVKISE